MKFILVLSVLSCLAVVQARQVKKCGTPITSLCADNKSQSCGLAPFCRHRSLTLHQDTKGCCCAHKGGKSKEKKESCSKENEKEHMGGKGRNRDHGNKGMSPIVPVINVPVSPPNIPSINVPNVGSILPAIDPVVPGIKHHKGGINILGPITGAVKRVGNIVNTGVVGPVLSGVQAAVSSILAPKNNKPDVASIVPAVNNAVPAIIPVPNIPLVPSVKVPAAVAPIVPVINTIAPVVNAGVKVAVKGGKSKEKEESCSKEDDKKHKGGKGRNHDHGNKGMSPIVPVINVPVSPPNIPSINVPNVGSILPAIDPVVPGIKHHKGGINILGPITGAVKTVGGIVNTGVVGPVLSGVQAAVGSILTPKNNKPDVAPIVPIPTINNAVPAIIPVPNIPLVPSVKVPAVVAPIVPVINTIAPLVNAGVKVAVKGGKSKEKEESCSKEDDKKHKGGKGRNHDHGNKGMSQHSKEGSCSKEDEKNPKGGKGSHGINVPNVMSKTKDSNRKDSNKGRH